MNPDSPKTPREEMETWLTSLLLGELSTGEAAAVRELMKHDPELARLHDELKSTIQLVREATVTATEPAPAAVDQPRLSEERRRKLQAAFLIPPFKPADVKPKPRTRFRLIELLAVLSVVAVLAAMLLPSLGKSKARAQRISVQNNLKQLDLAKQQWAAENNQPAEAAPTFEDLKPYLGRGELPSVAGEKYVLGKVGERTAAEVSASDAKQTFGGYAVTLPKAGSGDFISGSADGGVAVVDHGTLAASTPATAKAEGEQLAFRTWSVNPPAAVPSREIPEPGVNYSIGFANGQPAPPSIPGLQTPPSALIVLPRAKAAQGVGEPPQSVGKLLDGPAQASARFHVSDSTSGRPVTELAPFVDPATGLPVTPTPSGRSAPKLEVGAFSVNSEALQQAVETVTEPNEAFRRRYMPAEAGAAIPRVAVSGGISGGGGGGGGGGVGQPVENLSGDGVRPVSKGGVITFGNRFDDEVADATVTVNDGQGLDLGYLRAGLDRSGNSLSTNSYYLGDISAPDLAQTWKQVAELKEKADGEEGRLLGGQRGRGAIARGETDVQDQTIIRKSSTNAPIPQPEIPTSENNFSTFSLNVSDVSFKLAQASLEKGQMPDPASVRSEEFINAFDYRDPEPLPGAALAFAWERARYPFAHNRDLLRFSLKTAAAGRQAGRPLNLVLVLDNSGSMERADRVQIIRQALRVLANQLQPQDKLSVITFARTARLVADGISGDKAGEVTEAVSGLTPEGGTNLEEAMNLGYQTAARHFLIGGINRVVLLTDGAANLGDVEPASLKEKVEAARKQGIALDCFGIGWDGFNDDLLEVLARNGDGRYGFINSPEEAATDFVRQLAGALQVAASDVKVQVEFNPKRVTSYRQIGYAKHQLTKEQFRDNTVDAAEIAAREAGNALYTVEVNPAGSGPLGTVRVRYKVPGTTDYRAQAWDVPYTGNAVSLEQSSPAMRLAASAGAFAEWLVASPFAGEVSPDALLGNLRGVPEVFGADSRPKTLEWMIRQAKSVEGK